MAQLVKDLSDGKPVDFRSYSVVSLLSITVFEPGCIPDDCRIRRLHMAAFQ